MVNLATIVKQWFGTPADPSADIISTPPDVGEVNLHDFSKFAQERLIGPP